MAVSRDPAADNCLLFQQFKCRGGTCPRDAGSPDVDDSFPRAPLASPERCTDNAPRQPRVLWTAPVRIRSRAGRRTTAGISASESRVRPDRASLWGIGAEVLVLLILGGWAVYRWADKGRLDGYVRLTAALVELVVAVCGPWPTPVTPDPPADALALAQLYLAHQRVTADTLPIAYIFGDHTGPPGLHQRVPLRRPCPAGCRRGPGGVPARPGVPAPRLCARGPACCRSYDQRLLFAHSTGAMVAQV